MKPRIHLGRRAVRVRAGGSIPIVPELGLAGAPVLLTGIGLSAMTAIGITYIADDFDGPLPPEIQKYFDGEDDE